MSETKSFDEAKSCNPCETISSNGPHASLSASLIWCICDRSSAQPSSAPPFNPTSGKNLEIFSRVSFWRSFGDFGIFNKSPAFRVSFNRCPGVIAESYWVTEPTNPNLIVVGPRGAIVVCFKSLNSREKKKTTNRFHAHRLTVFTILCLEGPRRTLRHLSGIVWLKIKPKNSTAIPFRIA